MPLTKEMAIKVESARKYLKDNRDLPISEIANRIGYGTPPRWLYNLRKELEGIKPEGSTEALILKVNNINSVRSSSRHKHKQSKSKPEPSEYIAVPMEEERPKPKQQKTSGQIKLVVGSPQDIAELLKSGI